MEFRVFAASGLKSELRRSLLEESNSYGMRSRILISTLHVPKDLAVARQVPDHVVIDALGTLEAGPTPHQVGIFGDCFLGAIR